MALTLVLAGGAAGYDPTGSAWELLSNTSATVKSVGTVKAEDIPITVAFNANGTYQMTDDRGGGLGGFWVIYPDGKLDVTLDTQVLEFYVVAFTESQFDPNDFTVDEVEITNTDVDARFKVSNDVATLTVKVAIKAQAIGSFEGEAGTAAVSITIKATGSKSVGDEYESSQWRAPYDEWIGAGRSKIEDAGVMEVIVGPDEGYGLLANELLIIEGNERWLCPFLRYRGTLEIEVPREQIAEYLSGQIAVALGEDRKIDAWHGLELEIVKLKTAVKMAVNESIKVTFSAKLKVAVSINHKQRNLRGVWRRSGVGVPMH